MTSLDSSTDSFFDEDWKAFGGDEVGLGAITAFTANFDGQQDNQCNVGGGLDPQLFSTASSPAMSHAAFDTSIALAMPLSTVGGMIPDCYPTQSPHSIDSATGQMFDRSVEHHDIPMLQQPLHSAFFHGNHLHRRSVSEPPDQHHLPGYHFQPRPQPTNPTFTRAGIPLGAPQGSATRHNVRGREPMYRQPYSVAKRQAPRQERYQLRRTQTQPVRAVNGPTSVPQIPVTQSPISRGLALPPTSAVVSTRVCTPAPSPDFVINPANIDPRLLSDTKEKAMKEEEKAAAIPVTIDELKAMIIDAVQQAINGTNKERSANVPAVGEASTNVSTAEPIEGSNDTANGEDSMECIDFDVDEDVVESIEQDNIVVKPN